ncbi:hypothetical protein SAMN05421766_10834 [Zobellia uliginosa]|uniref:Uncharacterized protein n=2 Tax=Zobellia uliginosa TaxID=143224 RepID=A0ABY1L0Z6_9FLAO|nr:hypothetical protein SAMN05421766_10834 [Zobellia uliginosa]
MLNMRILDRFFKRQKKYLDTPEHYRAFSAHPKRAYCQLSNLLDNSSAIEFIQNHTLKIKHVQSGTSLQFNELIDYHVIFVVTWDIYCAKSIGFLKRKVENKEISKWCLVLFEETEKSVKANKSDSWYYDHTYVLDKGSKEFAAKLGRVPLVVSNNDTGKAGQFITGMIE